MPGGPKLGNTFPGAISSYPSWQAHITPYTAEWGNSVGFEFYLVEYTLGENPQGEFNNVADRLDNLQAAAGFTYFFQGRLSANQTMVATDAWGKVDIDTAIVDHGSMWNSGSEQIDIPHDGFYEVNINLVIVKSAGLTGRVRTAVRTQYGQTGLLGQKEIMLENGEVSQNLTYTFVGHYDEGMYIILYYQSNAAARFEAGIYMSMMTARLLRKDA